MRVTPISETAEIGMAVGAAFAGYRPVVQLYMSEFMLVAMDQVVNEAPRFHYMTARPGEGADRAPGRLRVHGRLGGPAHGNDLRDVHGRAGPEGPGILRGAADAKGLMKGLDPRRQPRRLLPPLPSRRSSTARCRRASTSSRSARRRCVREGSDVTIVGWPDGAGRPAAAESSPAEGVSAEVIDPRTLAPLDTETISIGGEDRPARRLRPVDAPRIGGGGDLGQGRLRRLFVAQGADQASDVRSTRRSRARGGDGGST